MFAGRHQEHPRLKDVLRSAVQARDTAAPSIVGYEFAASEARRLLGPDAKVDTAAPGVPYNGRMIGETPTHWIQRITPTKAVLHDKQSVVGAELGSYGSLLHGDKPATMQVRSTSLDGGVVHLSRNGKLLSADDTAKIKSRLLGPGKGIGR